jgi:hypothetical protein
MKTDMRLLKYLAQFFLEWKMFEHKICRENQNRFFVQYFRKSCRLRVNVEEYGTARQATDDNIVWRMPDT